MVELGDDLLTVKQLQDRWGKRDARSVRLIARRYVHILQPMKIGRNLMFYPEAIEEFEKEMRVIRE